MTALITGKHKHWRFKAPHTTVQESNCGWSIWVSDAVSYFCVSRRPPGWHGESVFPFFMALHSLHSALASKQTTMHQTSNKTNSLLATGPTFPHHAFPSFLSTKLKPSLWFYSPYCQLRNCTVAILGAYLIVNISKARCLTCFTTYQGG